MVHPEKRLLWHPRQSNKFVVGGGSQITLYEWAPENHEIRQVTSQHDLQHMKCFAWSPDPSFEDLVAVGNSTGKIELLRLEASKHAHQINTLSSGPIVTLQLRNSRACNALAFCSANPNYLASGFDKVRGDHSLIIWDITAAAPALSIYTGQPHSNDPKTHAMERSYPLIPRAETAPRTDGRITQQHAQSEAILAACFLPHSTQLLLAGVSQRWLRLFDLRVPVPTVMSAVSKVQGLATDPFDPNRIASFGDGTVTLWDSRKLPQPLLMFTEKDASGDGGVFRANSGYAGLEFSSIRRGTLGTLERDSSYVRFWDVMSAHSHTVDEGPMDEGKSKDLSRAGRRSWANLSWPSGSGGQYQTQPSPKESDVHTSLALCDTRRTKRFVRSLASFALVPSLQAHPIASKVMVVNKEGDLELYALHDTPKQATWSSRGDLAISAGATCRILEGFPDTPEGGQWDTQDPHGHAYDPEFLPSRSRSRDDLEFMAKGRSRSSKNRDGPVIPQPPSSLPPFFGRGDEDGFPALTSPTSRGLTNLAATRPGQGRGYTPSELYNYDLNQLTATNGVNGMTTSGRKRKEKMDNTDDRENTRNQTSIRGKRPFMGKSLNHVVEDDISMVMKRRALRGYGLSKPQNNITIVQDNNGLSPGDPDLLSDLWAWMSYSNDFLTVPSSVLHGYDFAYQGLLGIWERFPSLSNVDPSQEKAPLNMYLDPPINPYDRRSPRHGHFGTDDGHGSFQAALIELTSRRPGDRSWKPLISTGKPLQRQIALQLCGWTLRDDDLADAIKRWEKAGEYSKAACWLVFTKQYSKAIDVLIRSSDEAHRMMSGTVAALVPHSPSSKSAELRDHCQRLIVRLQDPYFRALLTHLALNDWHDVLEEETIPFRERLAIAFQFLDDKAVTSYLRLCIDRSVARGKIDGIIVPGLASKAGLNILQCYLDRTGDVQSAAILGSYVCPPGRRNGRLGAGSEARVERWVEGYRDLLDGFKMFHHRVGFDIERGQVGEGGIGGTEWVPRQILIRCNYCNKAVNGQASDAARNQSKGKPTTCPHCNRALPRCSICLMTLGIIQDAAREIELLHSQYKDTIDDAIVMCQTCRHGGHAAHILDWFYGEDGTRSHGVCAVANCNCRCAEEM